MSVAIPPPFMTLHEAIQKYPSFLPKSVDVIALRTEARDNVPYDTGEQRDLLEFVEEQSYTLNDRARLISHEDLALTRSALDRVRERHEAASLYTERALKTQKELKGGIDSLLELDRDLQGVSARDVLLRNRETRSRLISEGQDARIPQPVYLAGGPTQFAELIGDTV